MKLYIKQNLISLNESFKVFDEDNSVKYEVEGKLISIGHKFTIYKNKKEVAYIAQKVLNLLPKFDIYMDGEKVASIHKKLSLLHPVYEIEGLDWKIKGNITSHEYSIYEGSKLIALISKKWLKITDTYEINIEDKENEIIVLAMALAIDAVLSIKRNKNSLSDKNQES